MSVPPPAAHGHATALAAVPEIYGLMAQYDTPEQLLAACERARDAGFRCMDAYAPFPVHGLSDALGQRKTRIPLLVLAGGIAGALTGFFMQYYANVISYPINVAGRPYNSWPTWIPVTFEVTILFAGLTTVFGMILLNGLPQPYHPVFNAAGFGRASRDKFFLCIEARDPKYHAAGTAEFLQQTGPEAVVDVPV